MAPSLPHSSYAHSVTAAFAVIAVLWAAKQRFIPKLIQWVQTAGGAGSSSSPTAPASGPPSPPPGTTTSSGGTGPNTRGVTGG